MQSDRFKLTRRNIIDKVLVLLSGSTVAQGLKVISLLLIARHLGAETYGLYVASITVASVSAIVFNFGLNTWLLREGARDEYRLPKLASTIFAIKFVFGIIWFFILSLLFQWLNLPTFPPELVRLAAIVVWLDNALITGLTVFKTILRNYLVSVIETVNAGLLLIGTIIFVHLNSIDVIFYVQIRLGMLLVSAAATWLLIWRWQRLYVDLHRIWQILCQAVPYALADLSAWISTRADVTVLAFILGEYYVGIYSPAVGLISTLYFIPGTVFWVMVPVLSNLFTTNIYQAVRTSRHTILLLAMVGLGMTTAVLLGANLVVILLGPSYAPSKTILRIISFVLIFKSISFAMAIILVSVGRQARRTGILVGSVLVNVIMNLMIIPIWGVIGAAVVYVITEAILMAGYTWQTWPYLSTINSITKRPSVVDEVIS